MASLKHSSSVISRPPSYREEHDVEQGRRSFSRGVYRTEKPTAAPNVVGGYHDYDPNAPHDPNALLDANDKIVHKQKKAGRWFSVPGWLLYTLCGALLLLIALLGLLGGLLSARNWLDVRVELVVNGATLNGSTLLVVDPNAVTTTATTTQFTVPVMIIITPDTPSASTLPPQMLTTSVFQTFSVPGSTVTMRETTTDNETILKSILHTLTDSVFRTLISQGPTVTVQETTTNNATVVESVLHTLTNAGPTVTMHDTKTNSATVTVTPSATVTTGKESVDPGKTVVVVTPPAPVVTSVLVLTTTLPTLTPAASSTKSRVKENGSA